MSTYSSVPAVSGGSAGSTSTTGAFFTVPANSFAVANLNIAAGAGTVTVLCGGQVFVSNSTATEQIWTGIYVPAGGSINVSSNGSGKTITSSWVIFTNGL